jgi:hypothetical protein
MGRNSVVKLLIFLGVFCAFGPSNAQNTGLVFDDDSYAEIPGAFHYSGAKGAVERLDTTFKVDLKPFCPAIDNQGDINSCVGWACGYASMTIQKAFYKDWKNQTEKITQEAFSPMFLFNQITQEDCGGSRLRDAGESLKLKGNLRKEEFNAERNSCDRVPTPLEESKAQANRIFDYTALFIPSAAERVKIEQIKMTLVQNRPVVVGLAIKQNFTELTRGTKFWWPNAGNTNSAGGHALCVVGYDDGKGAFEIMNSWGSRWGNGGYIWIKYKDFAAHCKYALDIVMDFSDGPKEHLVYGELKVKRPFMVIGNDVTFEDAEVALASNANYTRTAEIGTNPEVFQVWYEGGAKQYVYVISQGSDGNVKLHWPKSKKLDPKIKDQAHSALIPDLNVPIPFPEAYSTFGIDEVGEDVIYFIFSDKAQSEIKNVLAYCRNYKKDVDVSLKKYLGSKLMKESEVDLTDDKMSFVGRSATRNVMVVKLTTDVINRP